MPSKSPRLSQRSDIGEPALRQRRRFHLESSDGWRKDETTAWFFLVRNDAFEFHNVLWCHWFCNRKSIRLI